MSLLLDARKKSQSALDGDGSRSGIELSLEDHPNSAIPSAAASTTAASHHAPSSQDNARMAGQNLFGAKLSPAPPEFAGISRSLLLALAGTVLFLAVGGGYVWYITSAGSNQPVFPIVRAPAAAPVTQPPPLAEAPKSPSTRGGASSKSASAKPPARAARAATGLPPQPTHSEAPAYIERHQSASLDPLLNSAYLAYREGKLDQAQQLYLEALKLDGRNADVLLGLAAIAQRRGADDVAVHYYAKALQLNPRDPVANAGMSALTANDNVESRLKILINEQPDSSSLHFALGNFYAARERWAEAQQAYFQAFRLEPRNAGLAFNLAISLDRLGKNRLAAEYYRSALQLDASRSESFDHAKISQRIEELAR